jgi:hypothetical protein
MQKTFSTHSRWEEHDHFPISDVGLTRFVAFAFFSFLVHSTTFVHSFITPFIGKWSTSGLERLFFFILFILLTLKFCTFIVSHPLGSENEFQPRLMVRSVFFFFCLQSPPFRRCQVSPSYRVMDLSLFLAKQTTGSLSL